MSPRIRDSSGPAAQAGLQTGDTLLAYNGRDLRTDAVNRAALFVPKRTLRVRIKRDGRVREGAAHG